MKIAVVGSRRLKVNDLGRYLPAGGDGNCVGRCPWN